MLLFTKNKNKCGRDTFLSVSVSLSPSLFPSLSVFWFRGGGGGGGADAEDALSLALSQMPMEDDEKDLRGKGSPCVGLYASQLRRARVTGSPARCV